MTRLPAILVVVVAGLQSACGLDLDGRLQPEAVMDMSPAGDATTADDDGGNVSLGSDGAVDRDGCGRCSDRESPSESDGPLDAPFGRDADEGSDDSGLAEGGPGPDSGSSVDAAPSCITGAVKCLFLALPCCTAPTAGSYYGTCAALAVCR